MRLAVAVIPAVEHVVKHAWTRDVLCLPLVKVFDDLGDAVIEEGMAG